MKTKLINILQKCLFPPNGTCPVCGKVLFSHDHFLCSGCNEDLPIINIDTCERCGRPISGEGLCKNCLRAGTAAPDGGVAWLDYTGSSRKIIAEMKYNGRQGLCRYVGKQLGRVAAQAPWLKEIHAMVPVPLHPNRQAERGYNQATLLAEGIAEYLSDETGIRLPITSVLERYIDTPHQVGLGRTERLTNLDKAFRPMSDSQISGRSFLLVDDVTTTGATLQACTAVLRKAGAEKVYTAVAAAVGNPER